MEKRDSPILKNYLQISEKLPKYFWSFFSWWTSQMNDLSSYVYVKKWIIAVILNKLILIYLTWFVHDFVSHKYNVLLKRNDVCLIPLNTLMCVFHVHLPWRLHLSGTVGMSGKRSMMLCWKRFYPLPSPFIATLAPSLVTLSCLHTRRDKATNQLACVSLVKNWIWYSCNFVTFTRFNGGKKSELSVIKWPRNHILNVVIATLWQRWTATMSQRRRPSLPQLSFLTMPQRCDNVNHDVVTTLSQRCLASWVGFSCKQKNKNWLNQFLKIKINKI